LPRSIGDLHHLTKLFLTDNELTEIPELLGNNNLPIVTLDVSYNRLTQLPSSTGKLAKLDSLDASGNTIRQLPASIRELPMLQYLMLKNNNFEAFPAELLPLVQDEDNAVTAVMSDLLTLYLDYNQITSLPAGPPGILSSALPAIAFLGLAGNRIGEGGEFPLAEVLSMRAGAVVNLEGNGIAVVPSFHPLAAVLTRSASPFADVLLGSNPVCADQQGSIRVPAVNCTPQCSVGCFGAPLGAIRLISKDGKEYVLGSDRVMGHASAAGDVLQGDPLYPVPSMLGDQVCDSLCNTAACGWDGGDCSTAERCVIDYGDNGGYSR
jgi:hypothetical protein